MQVRRATMEDMHHMQNCNLRCLPENYNIRYYLYHYLSWPQLLYLQEDYNGKPVGYVLGKMDDEENAQKKHGHITSLAVLRSHRRLGIASRVMRATMREMEKEYDANFCSLHVRKTNDAALHLYQETLQFRCAEVDEKYYLDEEDAYHMRRFFKGPQSGFYVTEDKRLVRIANAAAAAVIDSTGSPTTATASAGGKQDGASGDGKRGKGQDAAAGGKGKKNAEQQKQEQLALAEELLKDEFSKSDKKQNKGGNNNNNAAAAKKKKK